MPKYAHNFIYRYVYATKIMSVEKFPVSGLNKADDCSQGGSQLTGGSKKNGCAEEA